MRGARANDYWKIVYNQTQKFPNYLKSLSFIDSGGTKIINFNPGISVLCGLNGAGKSSIISSVKHVLGVYDDSIISRNKFLESVSAEVIINKASYNVNTEFTAVQAGLNSDLIKYIDSDQALDCIKYWEQTNLDELLESVEENTFSPDQLQELSEIVGKSYTACTSYELSEEEDGFLPVFFRVGEGGVEYDSTGMGLGEHFLIRMYYILSNASQNSIIIIEEPETYISVPSQEKLMNFLAKVIVKRNLSLIVSTHSPHIINMINNSHISVLSRFNNRTCVYNPEQRVKTEGLLGLDVKENEYKTATIFTEDYAARVFLNLILSEELPSVNKSIDLVSVSGESEITARLSFPDRDYMSHLFVGVYDGDIAESDALSTVQSKVKWPYLFLPVRDCVEKEMMQFLSNENNVDKLSDTIGKSSEHLFAILSRRNGEDHHDWLPNVSGDLGIKSEDFIGAFYSVWKEQNIEAIDAFVNKLKSVID